MMLNVDWEGNESLLFLSLETEPDSVYRGIEDEVE